jgi:hypothetical protein
MGTARSACQNPASAANLEADRFLVGLHRRPCSLNGYVVPSESHHEWCSVPDPADQYCHDTHSAIAALGIARLLRGENSSAELEQPLQVGSVAPGADNEAVLDLQYERRGEYLRDAGGGDAQELVLGTAVTEVERLGSASG